MQINTLVCDICCQSLAEWGYNDCAPCREEMLRNAAQITKQDLLILHALGVRWW
jgi:hypothetical protein